MHDIGRWDNRGLGLRQGISPTLADGLPCCTAAQHCYTRFRSVETRAASVETKKAPTRREGFAWTTRPGPPASTLRLIGPPAAGGVAAHTRAMRAIRTS